MDFLTIIPILLQNYSKGLIFEYDLLSIFVGTLKNNLAPLLYRNFLGQQVSANVE